MKTAYVCLDPGIPIPSAKGASVHVVSLVRALARAGHPVTLFIRSRGPGPFGPMPDGVDVRLVRSPDDVRGALAGHDLVYERYSLEGTAGLDAARDAGVPYFLEVNAPLLEEGELYRRSAPTEAQRHAEVRLLREADRVLAVSSELIRFAEERGADSQRLRLFRNAVDADAFAGAAPLPSTGTTQERFGLVFVSGLRPWHGVALLLDAFDRLWRMDPTYSLSVVGDGPLAENVDRFVRESPSGHAIIRTGRVDPSAIPAILASARMSICPYDDLPSFYFCPLKVFEYMAAARPVVASRIGDLPAILGDGTRGVLVPPGDPAALATAIDTLRRDPERASTLARRGREHVLASETWAHRVKTLEAMVAELRSPPGRTSP